MGQQNRSYCSSFIRTGENTPWDLGLNPSANIIYVANSNSNTTSVIDAKTNSVVATPKVGGTPVSIAYNPTTNMIYVVILVLTQFLL